MKSFPKRLTGRMLVARPELLDPNFMHSIVFLVRHSENAGALGFILNRPLGMSLAEAAGEHLAEPFFEKIPALMGGPVGNGRFAVIVFEQTPKRRAIRSLLGLPLDRIKDYLDKPNTWVRAFNGYAGWSAGQLERELREGSWKVVDAEPAALDTRFARGLWPFLIANDNRWRALVDYIPPEVERN